VDAFEQYVRSGLELAGIEVDDTDLAVMRAADATYGPALTALQQADLKASWPEPVLDPSQAPPGSPPAHEPAGGAGASQGQDATGGGDPQDLSLRAQAAGIAEGDLDPAELLDNTFKRIEERGEALGAVIASSREEAERMLADAPQGPLHGVPVAVKDQFALPWRGPTDGTPIEVLPAGESGVYRRLRDAGAVIPAVTNMHWWGAGTTGAVSAYGPARNPWDPERCAGGSSGGSAASVAARIVAGAVGADGGGSIRLPSAYCGDTGLKPTWGTVPTDGNVHGYLSMDSAGPICRESADARLLGEVLTGAAFPASDGNGLRAGIVRNPFWDDSDPEVAEACQAALDASGWEVEELEIEGIEHTAACTVLGVTIEGLPTFEPEDIAAADPIMRALGKYQLLLSAGAYERSRWVRSILRRSTAAAFGRVDVLVWPSVPAPAPRIDNPTVELPSGTLPADAANVRQAGLGNLTGIPGASVPVGLHSSGVPIGLMIQAPWGEDARVLDAAEHIERATDREFVDAAPPLATPA
jgi:aspartyl-tRNA(Asn)/glutamyl-tRNA(Gln) amidotransferase subunit A